MGIRFALTAGLVLGRLMAEAPPVLTSIVTPSAAGEGMGCSWARIEAPAVRAARHLEIGAPGAERVWLNGSPVERNELGGYDVAWTARARNIVVLRPPGLVELRVTPRVFVARVERAPTHRRVRIWVRNTLENTSNVFLSLRGEGAMEATVVEVTATVPPGVTQIVDLEVPRGAGPGVRFAILDKEEEAMEGSYQHRVPLPDLLLW